MKQSYAGNLFQWLWFLLVLSNGICIFVSISDVKEHTGYVVEIPRGLVVHKSVGGTTRKLEL